jgi:hypothetical protein
MFRNQIASSPAVFHQPGCGDFVFWRFGVWLSSVLGPDE